MTRLIVKRKSPAKSTATSYRAPRRQQWVDPWPEVEGTEIEKRVYAELVRRGIPFFFQKNERFEPPDLGAVRWHRADFVIPDARIIINPLGTYWHSSEGQIDEDSTVYAFATLSGWKYLLWWDFQIMADLSALFDKEPGLRGRSSGPLRTPPPNLSGKHDSAGIKTINRNRKGRIRKGGKTPHWSNYPRISKKIKV